jgi:two-component system phosphate regulon sensor histidine kinase PhoR
LVLALSGAAATGVVLVWVFVRKEANLSRLQSDFVSKVSHELRTPLTSIRLFSETLALGRTDQRSQEKCIHGLQRETARLQALIDRLLDWGRMESGHREFDLRKTDVQSIVDTAVGAVRPMLDHMGASLTVEMSEHPIEVVADRGAMSDALLNLLTNACKYGGAKAAITLRVVETSDVVRVEVQDNGKGIPPTEHKRIFLKFYRVDDRLAREQEGSGLGLSIVKHVMRAHMGKVEVSSTPGQGSTFSLVIPASKTTPVQRPDPAGSSAG